MPKRKSVKRVTTNDLQGEGSFVVYRPMKVKEVREARKQAEENPDFDSFEGGLEMLVTHILDWNWVDDEGNPFPKPADDPSILEELTTEETEFLAGLLLGEGEDLKN